jgi:hypothetical protein
MDDHNVRRPAAWKILLSGALLVAVYLGSTVPLLQDWPPPWPDESHFAEPAAVLARTGTLHSEFIPAFSREILWQPPGYFHVLAAVIPVVGFDFAHLRMVSIVTGGLLCLVVWSLGMATGRRWGVALLAAGLLAVNPNFTTYIKLIRMDGLCMLLQAVGMLVLIRAQDVRRSWVVLPAAGMAFAAGILVHPLGVLGLSAGAIYILQLPAITRGERVRALGLLVIPTLCSLAYWFLFVVRDHGAFVEQMRMQFGRKSRPPWESIANCVQRYRSIPAFAFFVLVTIVTWVRGRLWRRSAAYAAVGGAAVLSTIVVALAFELQYHIFMLPWLSLCGALGIADAWDKAGRRGRMVVAGVVAAVLINLLAYPLVIYATLHTVDPVPEPAANVYERAGRVLPEGASVLLCGYPDGYWLLRERRPDLRLLGGIAFSPSDRSDLREAAEYAVVARSFDPLADSVALFRDLQTLLAVTPAAWDIVAREGTLLRYHPSLWVLRLHRGEGKGSGDDRN